MNDAHTHYVPALCERNGRKELAACNIWIPAIEHTNEPTCPTCQAYIADGCRELSADEVFGTFDPLQVVKHIPFNPLKDYTERRR